MLALHKTLHRRKPRETQPFHPGAPGYWPTVSAEESRMSKTPLRAIAILALGLVIAGCQANTAPAPKVERPVQVQRIAYANEDGKRDFVGVVRARYETDLGFRVPGKIVARLVNVGDRVQADDVIARLDPQDLQLQVESAEAEFGAATSALTQATAEFERSSQLKARGFASNADFDRKQSIKDEADGRVERARRSLNLARNQLGYSELKAGADGVITAITAEPGQVVPIGQPVARLARHGEREAIIALPETWLADARKATATVRLWSERDRSFKARLRELSPQADAATRTYAARFTIEDAGDTVALGMTATVTLSRADETAVARVPLSAILNRGNGASVFVVDETKTLALRPVTIASFTEQVALVTSGVRDGDEVVTLGVQKLETGLKVRTLQSGK
jgi:RND family efflux transporter MFP subunit